MSKISMTKKSNKKNESSLERKKQFDAKATNPNVFGMENFLNEDRDENLEIFHQKEMKRSDLPSISTLLSSNNEESGISTLLNNSNEKPRQKIIQKYPQNGDIFSSAVENLSFNNSRHFDKNTSPSLNKSHRKSRDYSISDMFSDGLSQEYDSEREFVYASGCADSQANLLPLDIKVVGKNTGACSIGRKDCKKKRKLEEKNFATEESGYNFLCANFERKKQTEETTNGDKKDNPLKLNKDIEKNKALKKFLSTVLSSDQKYSGIGSLLPNSINETQKSEEDGEHCIVCRDENLSSSPLHRIYQKSKDCSTSDMFDVRNSTHEMIYDADIEKSEPYTIDIVLSECNLDCAENSEDLMDESIEMINKRALWYMDDNNLMDNRPELITGEKSVLCENTRMNYSEDKTLELSDLLGNGIDYNGKNSVVESTEAIKTSQNSFKLSDSLKELLNVGSQLSDQSKVSPISLLPEFDFSQNCRMSFEEKNVRQPDSRHSSFGISQAMYVKQKSSFFNGKKHKDRKKAIFELDVSIPKDVDELRTEIHSPTYKKHNYKYTSNYEYNDSDKENEMEISCSQKQRANHKNFGKEFMNSNVKRSVFFNSVNKSSTQRYPLDKNCEFLNIEGNRNGEVEYVGTIQNTWSKSRDISIDQISGSTLRASNISNENAMKRSHSNSFWEVSHEVQNIVKEWLDKQDGIDCKISKQGVDREKLSSKHRWLDSNGEKRENGIDMDPKRILANYSCEYDRAYKIEYFKI